MFAPLHINSLEELRESEIRLQTKSTQQRLTLPFLCLAFASLYLLNHWAGREADCFRISMSLMYIRKMQSMTNTIVIFPY